MYKNCFHCQEPIAANIELFVEIDKIAREMCCYGCKAVAEQIMEFGLSDYYRHRTRSPQKPDELVPEELKTLTLFNSPQIQSEFVSVNDDSTKEAKLIIEGISCPACTWLIESRLSSLAGVKEVNVNYSTQRCRIVWQEPDISLSDILMAITRLGYSALPYNPKQRELIYDNERKAQLIRLGIAGLFGMQVMMIAIALYFGEASGIETHYRLFFHWISLLLTLPVLFYSGQPLFAGAYRDIKNKRPGMDVPIALGLSIAFISSLWSTLYQTGHVYYDSIVMFIFFIMGGRYFEFMSRRKSTAYLDKVTSILPLTGTRVGTKGEHEVVEVNGLAVADKVVVKPGEVIPVDGVIYEGRSSVNESIITGESVPVTKTPGMPVIGGSTNIESPLYMRVTDVGEHTVLSNIARIIDRASSNKPAAVLLANKIVSIFICCLLVVAGLVALYWYHADQTQWLTITIAVLVVSCPCALSLATPTAFSSAAETLMRHGIALINNDAIEKIPNANYFIFDKTGTLTEGKLELNNIDIVDTNYSKENVLKIAMALESASEHPLAKAIANAAMDLEQTHASNITNYPGEGIIGYIDATWFIGTEKFINAHCQHVDINDYDATESLRRIVLANKQSIVAIFYFNDEIRHSSKALIRYLKAQGKQIVLMSGDNRSVVKHVAARLEIDNYQAELKPEDKMNQIARLQQQGNQICMIGDGINDAPAFAQADVAIAMAEASDITKLNADMLLLNDKIEVLKTMLKIVIKTNRTVRVNFSWALAYNIIALPFAISGFITPWMAALGMSISSLIVVINASRISTSDYV